MSNMTKICKYCKTEIPKDAKICPNCRKKQKGPLGLIIAGVIVVLVIGSVAGGGSGSKSTSAKTEDKAVTTASKEADVQTTEAPKEYITVTKQELSDELHANDLKAYDKYKDKYIEVSGYLDVIDSSGKYISINTGKEDFSFVNVQCYIKNDDQKAVVMDMNKGDAVTVKGKCKDVGEVLGYQIDIEEIITK